MSRKSDKRGGGGGGSPNGMAMHCSGSRVLCPINRVRPFNLGCCIFPSKVAPCVPFLGCLWTNLAESQWTFVLTLGEKSIYISAKYVHKWLRNDVSDTTFEAKIQQPKLKGRPLPINMSLSPEGHNKHRNTE